jgi:hypothetical protein
MMRKLSYIIKVVLILVFALDIDMAAADTTATTGKANKAQFQQSTNIKSADNLRGVYYTPPEEGPVISVGRLAVLLLEQENGHRQVNLHHQFHTGQSFQFIVSSNHDGWLYILHRSPGGEPQLLWPRIKSGAVESHLDYNKVQAGLETIVPESPGKFTFDDEVGNEYFYVVIRSERQSPELSAMETTENSGSDEVPKKAPVIEEKVTTSKKPATEQPSPTVSGQKIVQFSIRGRQHPIRGVVYDPGPQDTDPHTYFSSLPEDGPADVVFEFQLQHER